VKLSSKFSQNISLTQVSSSKVFQVGNLHKKSSVFQLFVAFNPILQAEKFRYLLVTNPILMVTQFEFNGDKFSLFEKCIFMVIFWDIYGDRINTCPIF